MSKFLLVIVFSLICMTSEVLATPSVIIETSKGNITVELDAEKAPVTVKNFLEYVDSGFYSDLIFHRVIPGFMIQGGGMNENMQQKTGRAPIKIESHNGLKNSRGTIAMARTNDPDSASSQFFINLVDNGFLDYRGPSRDEVGYTVFGKTTAGMEVVDAIAKVRTGHAGMHADVPTEVIKILSIKRAQ